MVEAVMLWNEPNNLSHWDFKIDPDWKMFAEMAKAGARAMRAVNPELKIVMGGISPIDPTSLSCWVRTAFSMRWTWSPCTDFRWTGITGRSTNGRRRSRRFAHVTSKPVWVIGGGRLVRG